MPGAARMQFSTNAVITASSATNPKAPMNISLAIAPVVSLIAGILILVVPRMLNYIVAIYLIIMGILGLFPHLR